MKTKELTVKISKNKKLGKVIMTFFTKNEKSGLLHCKTCWSSSRGYMFLLKQHLKVHHPNLWSRYLIDIGDKMTNKSTSPKYTKEFSLQQSLLLNLKMGQTSVWKCQKVG
jgi:hypothetical protein